MILMELGLLGGGGTRRYNASVLMCSTVSKTAQIQETLDVKFIEINLLKLEFEYASGPSNIYISLHRLYKGRYWVYTTVYEYQVYKGNTHTHSVCFDGSEAIVAQMELKVDK